MPIRKTKKQRKIGRNEPCPWGSGKKYKKCCRNKSRKDNPIPPPLSDIFERQKADELIRQQQQGMGRPIVSAKFHGQQFVFTEQTAYYSPNWKTFPDFLSTYIQSALGHEWGNEEIAKPLSDRHPILQWYDELYRYQKTHIKEPGEITSSTMTGVVYCYVGLAYSLYLLKHNVELQDRLVKRLKDPSNFQGAYYELIVANSLIRAGFELVLEDESDRSSKHCEFAAISKKTGKRYWVEAKMKGIPGFLGKTNKNGANNPDPTSGIIRHLNNALKKPAAGNERLIFVDLNTEPHFGMEPAWAEKTSTKLKYYERKLDPGQKAFVFITNFPFYRILQSQNPGLTVMAQGIGIPDFSKPGMFNLSEMYRKKQRHIDAYDILESLKKYPQLPATFDGRLPSRQKENPYDRIIIGESYFFEGIGKQGKGDILTVTSATVNEKEKRAYIGTSNGLILRKEMSDDEMDDYKEHPEAFFCRIEKSVKKKTDNIYELFEFFLDSYKNTPKEKFLEFMKNSPNYPTLQKMNQEDLAMEYCERLCAAIQAQNSEPK